MSDDVNKGFEKATETATRMLARALQECEEGVTLLIYATKDGMGVAAASGTGPGIPTGLLKLMLAYGESVTSACGGEFVGTTNNGLFTPVQKPKGGV